MYALIYRNESKIRRCAVALFPIRLWLMQCLHNYDSTSIRWAVRLLAEVQRSRRRNPLAA